MKSVEPGTQWAKSISDLNRTLRLVLERGLKLSVNSSHRRMLEILLDVGFSLRFDFEADSDL